MSRRDAEELRLSRRRRNSGDRRLKRAMHQCGRQGEVARDCWKYIMFVRYKARRPNAIREATD